MELIYNLNHFTSLNENINLYKPLKIDVMKITHVSLIIGLIFGLLNHSCQIKEPEKGSLPNIIIIFADDMGYGDLGVYGHPTIKTPNIDQLAFEGLKWTNFYASSSVCTPSRAGLLTGRLPIRSGMCNNDRRVLFPDSEGGLPQSEITISEALKRKNYETACFGKWHLGHLVQYLPINHGFDYYLGIPYSNDMDRLEGIDHYGACINPEVEYFNVPLMQDTIVIERPANQHTITKRYTEEVINFISENKDHPFFIYMAHSMPHVPLFVSEDFKGTSIRGLYGDVIQEIDWSVGRIIQALKENELDHNTLVIFTSDNGPWLYFKEYGGSAGILRDGKGTSYDGGMREPAIFWWPEKIKPGVITDVGSTLDLFPTINSIAGMEIPADRIYDGYDLSPVLFEHEESPRNTIFYYDGTRLFSVREGAYKAHFFTRENVYEENMKIVQHDPPLLFNLEIDPGEKYDISNKHPEVIDHLKQLIESHKKTIIPVENQLSKLIDSTKVGYEKKSL